MANGWLIRERNPCGIADGDGIVVLLLVFGIILYSVVDADDDAVDLVLEPAPALL